MDREKNITADEATAPKEEVTEIEIGKDRLNLRGPFLPLFVTVFGITSLIWAIATLVVILKS